MLRGSIDQKHAKTNEFWGQNSGIHSAFACSRWPPWFPDLSRPYGACVKRGSGNDMIGLSRFRPSWQSNISTSGEERFKYPLPRENKISQMPNPRANKDNQIPTPCPASPPRRHDIDRCIRWFIWHQLFNQNAKTVTVYLPYWNLGLVDLSLQCSILDFLQPCSLSLILLFFDQM